VSDERRTSPGPNRPEVLAPAGDRDAVLAAIRGGADAVYLGLQGFNARARAQNFDEAALEETTRLLHAHGVRAYVTLNTLVFDAELEAVARAVAIVARAGADAVIVQDLAVAQLARRVAPTLPVHASTQMTCTDLGSAAFAADLGASRVILARELSVDDIAAIASDAPVPVEVFVHGALCIAYSGQCLTSEAIGGRSANRGACAQACRLPYDLVVDGVVREAPLPSYLLSPADLDASALVPRLVGAKVASLKIEGRLKGPEYVEATARLYRAAVDAAASGAAPPSEAAHDRALQTYTRGSGPGFLGGIDHQRLVDGETCDHRGLPVGALVGVRRARGKRWLEIDLTRALARGDGVLAAGSAEPDAAPDRREIGGRVWTIEVGGVDVPSAEAGERALVWLGPDAAVPERTASERVFKTSDPAVARSLAAERPYRVPIDVVVSGALGEPATLRATSPRGHRAEVTTDLPIGRAERGVTEAILRDKLGRLEPTPFELRGLEVHLPPSALVPLSSLNRARRELALALTASTHAPHAVTSVGPAELAAALPPPPAAAPRGLFVLCRTLEQAHAALDAGADGIYLDFLELTGTGAAARALRERACPMLGVAPPRVRKPGEDKIDRYLASLAPDAVLVRGLGALREGATAAGGPLRIGDFSLNVTNGITARTVLARGLTAFTPSFDLDGQQLVKLLDGDLARVAEVVVHHPMPLFHMEHCVIAHTLSEGKDHLTCGRPCERHQVSLRDRAGMTHPVEADVGCRNTVFHQRPQSAADLVPALARAGVGRFRVELVRERAREASAVVDVYRRLLAGGAEPRDVQKTLRVEGGYGVVRGSLRVL